MAQNNKYVSTYLLGHFNHPSHFISSFSFSFLSFTQSLSLLSFPSTPSPSLLDMNEKQETRNDKERLQIREIMLARQVDRWIGSR
jgi:hypothetical protein